MLLVALVAVVVSWAWEGREDRSRRMGAIGWALTATVVPGAWLVARWLPEWVGAKAPEVVHRMAVAAVIGLALHGLSTWASLYLSALGAAAERERKEKRVRRPASAESAAVARASVEKTAAARSSLPLSDPSLLAPSPGPSSLASRPIVGRKPLIRPPLGGTVAGAARTTGGAPPQADTLLRVLGEGTPMQRAAAAKALSLSFAGKPTKPVVYGLLGVMTDPDADDESRVEAWVAVCRVMGAPLSYEEEATLRRDGAEGIDAAQILGWQERLEDLGAS